MIQHHQSFNLFDKLLLEKVILVPPMTAPGIMPNEACFLYAVRGQSTIYSETERMPLHTEEGVVMKCGNYLNEWLSVSSQPDETCEAIAIHFYPEVLQKIYEKELPDFISFAAQTKPAKLQKVKADQLLKNYIDNLQFYFENPALVSEELLKLKVKELILLLAKTDNFQSIKELISSMFTPNEYSFKEIIEANIYTNRSNEELAMLTNLSLSSFKREFVKVYKASPAKYIKHRKLERAKKLLMHTQQRISDIAFGCGFREVSHFSKCFQQTYQMSPSEFRLHAQSVSEA